MKKKTFNPHEWLPKEEQMGKIQSPGTQNRDGKNLSKANASSDWERVEHVVQAIEASGTDLTGKSYADWRDLGFAFSDAFGENGRGFYHRISCFYPGYEPNETDKQYDRCLKASGSGIHLGTFFHHAAAFLGPGAGGAKPAQGSRIQQTVSGAAVSAARAEPEALGGTGEAGQKPSSDQDFWGFPAGNDNQGPAAKVPAEALGRGFEQEQDLAAASGKHLASLSGSGFERVPVFPKQIYGQLPHFLKELVAHAGSDEERDVLLMGGLTVMSAALPNVFGIYDRKRVYPNLFLFVTAPASAGKGQLSFTKDLVMPIHQALREKAKEEKKQYELALAEYNAGKKNTEKPVRPAERMLLLPANSSATGMLQLLGENRCRGLIFETEGDTMAQVFKSDYGNYSDSFRKAYHHEPISFFRRTDNEYVNLEEPRLSALLSGTPRQVQKLIEDPENGLFSRFAFYRMNLRLEWKDVFAKADKEGLEAYFRALGGEFARFSKFLKEGKALQIMLSEEQQQRFHRFFTGQQYKYLMLQPREFVASLRRMGLVCFRIIMGLSALRLMEEGGRPASWTCREEDFEVALEMVDVLLRHSSHVFYGLPLGRPLKTRENRREWLINNLPDRFVYQEALLLAQSLNISHSTLERDLADFVRAGLFKRSRKEGYERV